VQNTGDNLPYKQGDPVRVHMPADALRVLTDTGRALDDEAAPPEPQPEPVASAPAAPPPDEG
jgi:hypothetical protein